MRLLRQLLGPRHANEALRDGIFVQRLPCPQVKFEPNGNGDGPRNTRSAARQTESCGMQLKSIVARRPLHRNHTNA
jgi:hypothetical protein